MGSKDIELFIELTETVYSPKTVSFLRLFDNNVDKAVEGYFKSQSPALLALYNKYRDSENKSQIGIEGTINYLNDLGIEPEHISSLILCYFLKSPKMGVFTRINFINQWNSAKVSTIQQMASHIENLTHYYQDIDTFQSVYAFIFKFLLEQPNQKLLSYELLIEYWTLVFNYLTLSSQVRQRLQQWYTFVNSAKKNISHDTFIMFYEFLKEIVIPDPEHFQSYDEMSSWPSFIDEYVEYLVDQNLLTLSSN